VATRGDRQPRSKDLSAVDGPLELALVRPVARVAVPMDLVVRQTTLAGAIQLCVQLSGLEDKELYLALGVDAGHWSRITKGEGHFPVSKLPALMDLCGNEAPLLWLARERGYGLVVLQSEAERRAEAAERALRQEQDKVRMLTALMQGRAVG
jgi:hypothetical protein